MIIVIYVFSIKMRTITVRIINSHLVKYYPWNP